MVSFFLYLSNDFWCLLYLKNCLMYFVYLKKNGRFSFIKIRVWGMGFSCFLLYLRGEYMYE